MLVELIALIDSIPDWESKSIEDLHELITREDPRRLPKDVAHLDLANLADRIDVEVAETLVVKITEAGMPAMAQSLVARGLDFGSPKIQKKLDELAGAGVLPGSLAEKLRSFGVDRRSQWQRISDKPDPSVDDVEAAVFSLRMNRQLENAKAIFAQRMGVGDDPATVWSGAWKDAEH